MRFKQFFRFVPNTITSFNVLSGCLSVIFAFEGNLFLAGIFIIIASVFDFFDGMSARVLHAYSDMGKELDSLADMLSFGFAPAVIAHLLVKNQLAPNTALVDMSALNFVLVFSPFIIAVFSALRLAKFNIDTRQSESFIGLNTPSNAMIWASIPFIIKYSENQFVLGTLENVWFLIGLAITLSLLLVAELPMFSLKFKNLKFADNKPRFILISLSIVLLITLKLTAIPLIIITYIVLSLVNNFLTKK
ncbi:MAG: CDP-alcohol phosphatidyltransferase family protein [Salinivirgaceae bacterium]|nr:CDP-alcohol phosphatidyltransferase family protein [Salinivirgaceae bacterium]